jgi:hypothetical protein
VEVLRDAQPLAGHLEASDVEPGALQLVDGVGEAGEASGDAR